MAAIGNDWDEILKDTFDSEHYRQLRQFLIREYQLETVYPPMEDLFNALRKTPYGKVKAVILGQDPYHGPGQAHGMCFSVRPGIKAPPSLVNIFKELQREYGYEIPGHGNLSEWARQGVLLLNTILTVRAGQPMSHKGMGWEQITDTMIRRLSERSEPMVFLLWGASAQRKADLIDSEKHLILKTTHPSPLSAHRGFFGCDHFREANAFLEDHGIEPIRWQIG